MALVPITNNTGAIERLVRVNTPPKPDRTPVNPDTINVSTGGVMISGRYVPHEYCRACADTILKWRPDAPHRDISLYEVLTSYREYRCSTCNVQIWDTSERI